MRCQAIAEVIRDKPLVVACSRGDEVIAARLKLLGGYAGERENVARDRLIGAARSFYPVCARWRLNIPNFAERSDDGGGVRVGAFDEQRPVDVKEQ